MIRILTNQPTVELGKLEMLKEMGQSNLLEVERKK
jgi:hypothetical protein